MKCEYGFVNKKMVNIVFFLLVTVLPYLNKLPNWFAAIFLFQFFFCLYKNRNFRFPKGHKIFLIGLISILLISKFSNSWVLSDLKREMYLFTFILIYYATYYFLRQKVLNVATILYAILISMTIYMINGYIQYVVGYDLFFHYPLQESGPCSVFANRNIFAIGLFYYIVILTYIGMEKKTYKMGTGILLLLVFPLMVTTLSRQMWLATILYFILLYLQKRNDILWHKALLYICLLGCFGYALYGVPAIHDRVQSLMNVYSSGRVELWVLILQHFQEAPFFGHGLHLPLNIPEAKIPYWYAHNLTMDILFDFGVFGMVIYIVFLFYFIKALFVCKNTSYKPYLIATFISIIFIQQQLGASMLIHKFVGPSIMILLALITYSCKETAYEKSV